MIVGTTDCNKSSLLADGWPNLQCHRLVVSTEDILQELRAVIDGKEDESLERASEIHDGKLSGKLLCNVYTPPWFLPNPIIFQSCKSWMKQYCERKMQQQEGCWVSLLMEIRLKEKLGMQSTLWRIKVEDNYTVPMCVTLAISPLGSLIEICTTEVIEVKNAKEWIIWSVAPLPRIQLVD